MDVTYLQNSIPPHFLIMLDTVLWCHLETKEIGLHQVILLQSSKKTNPASSSSWTFNLHTEKINFCCLNYLVCAINGNWSKLIHNVFFTFKGLEFVACLANISSRDKHENIFKIPESAKKLLNFFFPLKSQCLKTIIIYYFMPISPQNGK